MNPSPRLHRSLASAIDFLPICATAECIGIPAPGDIYCPYCSYLAADFDSREAAELPFSDTSETLGIALHPEQDAREVLERSQVRDLAAAYCAAAEAQGDAYKTLMVAEARAESFFGTLPGRVDVDAPAADLTVEPEASWLTPDRIGVLGLGLIALVGAACLPWYCAGLLALGMAAGWTFRGRSVTTGGAR